MKYAAMLITKDRPQELATALDAIAREGVVEAIVVVDASADDESLLVCDAFTGSHTEGPKMHFLRHAPGISAQRNAAVRAALEKTGCDVLCFLDDDTYVQPGYFAAIDAAFAVDHEGHIGGVGGIADDPKPRQSGLVGAMWRLLKRFFMLDGRPGAILKSGRNVQVLAASEPVDVDWLQGGACCYRRAVFETLHFDERLAGYSWGEDFDFGFRASRRWRLVQTPQARVTHTLSLTNRLSVGALARGRTILLHAWVSEHRDDGLSLVAYWWSLFGEILLVAGLTTMRKRPDGGEELRGLLSAAAEIIRHGSTRSLPLWEQPHAP